MELCGAPAVVADGNRLIYPYEDYVITFCNFNGDRADLIFIYSWVYFKDEADYDYEKIPVEYRYGH